MNWLPALILQVIMIGLGVGYATQVPWVIHLFEFLSDAKKRGGYLFSFTAGAIAAGFLSEVFRVYFVDGGKWKKHHLIDMVFKMGLMGGVSVMTDCFYKLQSDWFGSGTDWVTLHKKVAADMLGYSIFIAGPIQCLLFAWKHEHFSWSATFKKIIPLPAFICNQFIPLSLSNVCFWLPIVYVIYSMPILLQMPLNLIAATIWGILIITVSNESRR
jgi:hypothetical protein